MGTHSKTISIHTLLYMIELATTFLFYSYKFFIKQLIIQTTTKHTELYIFKKSKVELAYHVIINMEKEKNIYENEIFCTIIIACRR